MSNIKKTRTELAARAQQVKDQFAAEGIPVSQWADANGFARPDVYRVLNGFSPCKRGVPHQIAVKLGLKTESDEEQSRPTELLPCPFCGAQPLADVFEDEEDYFHFVSCENGACPASVCTTGHTPEAAAALWNTRNGGAA